MVEIKTHSFIVGESVPTWALSLGVKVIRDEKSKLVSRVLVPTGEGTGVVSANVGDTVTFIGNNAMVIAKEVADEYKA